MARPVQRWRVRVTGTVQGVGFRPFVVATARALGLSGHVGNDAQGVLIEAQGAPESLGVLVRSVRERPPPLAVVTGVSTESVEPHSPTEPTAAAAFDIVGSVVGAGSTSLPPDSAVCPDCLREMRDPGDRRFGYPFIACTNCGPRFTITTGLPYDRSNTTMARFRLCPECEREYTDPASRRYHAQPTACPRCGPRLELSVAEIVRALGSGRIVAIKGVGGYHLSCDASDAALVRRLRERKGRGAKPFAVMAADPATADAVARLDPAARDRLQSAARPIVIAPARDLVLAAAVAPGTGTLGVLLPYAPIHHLLFDAGAPRLLVMTSGNVADEPICISRRDAEARLAGIADVFAHHDRPIHVACDDSVLRDGQGVVQPVRRSRGYAPTPVALPVPAVPMVAVGGELKSCVCVADGPQAWLSQHIGDTANLATLQMLGRIVDSLSDLQHVAPRLIVSDAHPGYRSRDWAGRRAQELGLEHVLVQHHHAHLASLMAEHLVPAGRPVLGIVLDGTGYGDDATIWGGELLLGDYASVRRVGHLRPIPLPGGDAAIRHPARTALAHLWVAGLAGEASASGRRLTAAERTVLDRMLRTGSHCVPTTSMGRLFDAIASLLGVRHEVDYEAQAAIELEALAAAHGPDPAATQAWDLGEQALTDNPDGLILDPRGWIAKAVAEHAAGVPAGRSAAGFHHALARALVLAAARICRREGVDTVGLTGGVFANQVLTDACATALRARGLTVLMHAVVPPNDGGLALGQVAVAAARMSVRGPSA